MQLDQQKVKVLCNLVIQLEETAQSLMDQAEGIQALERNAERILASVAMLKINVNDVYEEA